MARSRNESKSKRSDVSSASDETENEVDFLDPSDIDLQSRKSETSHERRMRRQADLERTRFRYVNERLVNDVTLELLYKPHTITVLVILAAYLLYHAFYFDRNIYFGLKAAGGLFLVISAMAFPNGPFIRPHPILWRIVFGISVMYALLLQFVLFQNYNDVKRVLSWFDPVGLSHDELAEKQYAVNCSDVSIERIWSYMDIFAVGHFLGWAMKALLIRHWIICWYISCMWELTEVFFAHLLPNFQECWWDALILDVVICNGLGIAVGMLICRVLEMRVFHWESVKSIRTTKGKFKRAVLQFTPESWIKVDWFNSFALRRSLAIFLFIMVWLISELNTFFLKHVFAVDTSHPVVFWRIIFIALISAPSIRQYYLYITDPRIKRLGMQCWIYSAVCILELAICVKFGRRQLPALKIMYITAWIFILAIGTVLCVWLSTKWAQHSALTKPISVRGETRDCYLDSSTENLGALKDDVEKRRKRLRIADPAEKNTED
ncbi:L-serine-phosphatidylethanolamine phosphatidyltransferase [Aphelenchoides bicaudatus]|nr:L-serine-phosphatidylethanolamine phosphatidyltransferase [Aphelenchoides bicaudatus]